MRQSANRVLGRYTEYGTKVQRKFHLTLGNGKGYKAKGSSFFVYVAAGSERRRSSRPLCKQRTIRAKRETYEL